MREHIVHNLKIPDTNFDSLCAIRSECSGALSILTVDQLPPGA